MQLDGSQSGVMNDSCRTSMMRSKLWWSLDQLRAVLLTLCSKQLRDIWKLLRCAEHYYFQCQATAPIHTPLT